MMIKENFSQKKNRYLGITLLILSLFLFLALAYLNGQSSNIPIVFSEKDLLTTIWQNYKTSYLEAGSGRTLDKQNNNITTSEGESYTLLRSVWMDDKVTFDQSLAWTQNNLKHKNDNLHSWLFGSVSGNAKGTDFAIVKSKGGQNSATDAESDMALSLVFAYAKWNDKNYLAQARSLISDIWNKEVISIKGQPVLVANDVEKISTSRFVIINPSYFSPYAYRIFSTVDTKDNWAGVLQSSYQILKNSASLALNKQNSASIPPDWIEMNKVTGVIQAVPLSSSSSLTTNYGYDALRIPWRLAIDWQWYQDASDKQLLDSFHFFTGEWQKNKSIAAIYAHDGSVVDASEVPALYGGVIGYFMVSDSSSAQSVYQNKLAILYDPDKNSWKKPLSYYDDNWAWFGIALYYDFLPNLAKLLPTPLPN
jgi:endoglucanase